MNKILVKIVRGIMLLLSQLPLKVHYFFGDILSFLAMNVIKYRYDVVMVNLSRSFPDKKYKELKKIASDFYRHFGEISECIGALNVYVNRAFAYAIKNTEFKLWGADNAHTSEYGAYLAVCVFFTALFRVSASVLDGNGLLEKDARELQAIADKITLGGVSIESLEI